MLIEILPCADEAFMQSLGYFEIGEELKKALNIFGSQFKDIEFSILPLQKWNTPGPEDSPLYPEKIVRMFKRNDTPRTITEKLFEIEVMGMNESLELENELIEVLARKNSINYMLGFFCGRFCTLQGKWLLDSLKKDFSAQEKRIVIGFTGKIFRFNSIERSPIAFTKMNGLRNKDAYAVIGTWFNRNLKPSPLLVHEFGHIFGADHSESKKSIMFPDMLEVRSTDFDHSNKRMIKKTIMEL